jgi:hypothetical protein
VLPPKKPILKPVRVISHWALPKVLFQIEVSLRQIWLSTDWRREFLGLRESLLRRIGTERRHDYGPD